MGTREAIAHLRGEKSAAGVVIPRGTPAGVVNPASLPVYRTPPVLPVTRSITISSPAQPNLPEHLQIRPGDGRLPPPPAGASAEELARYDTRLTGGVLYTPRLHDVKATSELDAGDGLADAVAEAGGDDAQWDDIPEAGSIHQANLPDMSAPPSEAELDREVDNAIAHESGSAAARDLALWRRWKASGMTPETRDPVLLEQLIQNLGSVVAPALRRFRRTRVAPEAVERASRTLLVQSLEDFDPNKNVKLTTHVVNGQRRVTRFVRDRANTARITESRATEIGRYDRAKTHLEDDLGYTPSDEQIAAHMRISVKTIQKLKAERRNDHIASASPVADPFLDETPEHREILQLLPASLNANQLAVFEYTQGINGKPKVTSTGEIARRLGWSDAKVVGIRTQIAEIFKRYAG